MSSLVLQIKGGREQGQEQGRKKDGKEKKKGDEITKEGDRGCLLHIHGLLLTKTILLDLKSSGTFNQMVFTIMFLSLTPQTQQSWCCVKTGFFV